MPSNNTGGVVRSLAREFPGMVGNLISPGGWRAPIGPFAVDNGAFVAWSRGAEWNSMAFAKLLDTVQRFGVPPMWVVVPDVVADRDETLRRWEEWAPLIRDRYGWPLAFVGQDGMTTKDVPDDADVVFIGGTTEWKMSVLWPWCQAFKRVHVGRVNTYRRLRMCADAGAESCDGTGWIRGDQKQLAGLRRFLREESGRGEIQMTLMFVEEETDHDGR